MGQVDEEDGAGALPLEPPDEIKVGEEPEAEAVEENEGQRHTIRIIGGRGGTGVPASTDRQRPDETDMIDLSGPGCNAPAGWAAAFGLGADKNGSDRVALASKHRQKTKARGVPNQT